jgi:glyoxylase-like metal-dependent hydrolase (beta-lactamase superfamily II)
MSYMTRYIGLIGAALVALAPVAMLAATSAALAAAPAVGGQAPGYYRMHVGRFEVTALLDGTHPFQAEKLAVGAKPGEVNALLGAQALASPFEGMINAFLVNMGDRLVLIDSGAGNLYGKDGGGLVAAIRAAGYAPDQVDDIFITHLHEDHAGGLMLNGQPVFAHAIVHVSKRDADFWLDNRNQSAVNDLLKPFFPAIQKVVAPYIASGRLRTFAGDAPLLPGLRPIAAPGHTPGHSYYLIEDGGEAMLFWGDTVHMLPVQIAEPKIAIEYDWNVPMAIAARRNALALAAREGWWVAGAHVSFPGVGHIRSAEGGHVRTAKAGEYRWVPANYTLNR